MLGSQLLSLALNVVLPIVLLTSAWAHLANTYFFLEAVFEYKMVAPIVAIGIAIALPMIEIVLAIGLLLPYWRKAAYLGCGLMFLVFFVAQLVVVARGMTIDCGCFGSYSSDISVYSVATVGTLMLGTIIVCVAENQSSSDYNLE
jgi:putative oxidoreductase